MSDDKTILIDLTKFLELKKGEERIYIGYDIYLNVVGAVRIS